MHFRKKIFNIKGSVEKMEINVAESLSPVIGIFVIRKPLCIGSFVKYDEGSIEKRIWFFSNWMGILKISESKYFILSAKNIIY